MGRYYLFAAVIFVLIPVFAARPMTSLFAKQLGASMVEIGLITASFSIAPLIMAILAGRYIDRYGERIPLIIGSLGILLSLFLPFLFPFIPILYLSQLLLGSSQLLAILSIQNGVAKSAANQNLNQAIGSFSLFTSLGMLIGPLIGGYAAEHLGFQLSYILLASIPIGSIIISYYIPRSSSAAKERTVSKKTYNLKNIFLIPGLSRSILASMIILSSIDIFYVYFPLYAQSLGYGLSQIGWLLAAQSASNALVRIFMPKLAYKFGRVTILWVFMFIGALAYGAIPFMKEFTLLFITAFILGAGLGVTQPLTIILTYSFSPQDRTGEVLGIRLASNRLGQTIIPFILASTSTLIGLGPIFIIKSILLVIGAFATRKIPRSDEKVNTEEKHKKIQKYQEKV